MARASVSRGPRRAGRRERNDPASQSRRPRPGWAMAPMRCSTRISAAAPSAWCRARVALLTRKGAWLHRRARRRVPGRHAGDGGSGACVAPFLHDRPSTVAGVMTLYLLATGFMAVRRPAGQSGRLEIAGLLVALAVVAAGAIFIAQARSSPTGTVDGQPPQAFYMFLIVGTIARGIGPQGDPARRHIRRRAHRAASVAPVYGTDRGDRLVLPRPAEIRSAFSSRIAAGLCAGIPSPFSDGLLADPRAPAAPARGCGLAA